MLSGQGPPVFTSVQGSDYGTVRWQEADTESERWRGPEMGRWGVLHSSGRPQGQAVFVCSGQAASGTVADAGWNVCLV